MCYYNGLRVSRAEFIRLKEMEFELREYKERMWRPVQSGFDYSEWPIILPNSNKTAIDLEMMEWGFIPSYLPNREAVNNFRRGYKDATGYHPAITTLNAIGEEMLLPKKIYRQAALARRCLVPSSGFFEWRHLPQIGKKGQVLKATTKYPYFIYLPGHEYFFMAGIWQPWTARDTGETVNTFAIVTAPANELMAEVHNSKKRMPALLTEDQAYSWIFDELAEDQITALAGTKAERRFMDAYPIAKDFQAQPEPEAPVSHPELPPITL